MNDLDCAIQLHHNLAPDQFMWLWMKYVVGVRDKYHCTNCLRGAYGKRLSKHNPDLGTTPSLVLDEQPFGSFSFLYICGVIKKGYPRSNYPHNLHVVIRPDAGQQDYFCFANWRLQVSNGVFEPIPAETELPERYRSLPPNYTTCRIFRWAVCSSLNQSAGEP
jgi:hypothetical protein